MIIFVTKRKDHDPFIYKSAKIQVSDSLEHLENILKQNKVLGFDSEANGKRYFQTELLLLQIGNAETQVVIDFTEPDYLTGWRNEVISIYNKHLRPDHLFIGHNLKYDHNVGKPYAFQYPDFFDTLIGEQRLNLGSGLFNNLKDTYERYLQKYFPEDKETRKDFILMNKASKFLVKHITYAAGDVGDIIQIAKMEKARMSQTGQEWFIRNVEFPLVKVLGEIELTGLHLNAEKWTKLIQIKEKRRFECEKEMDLELVTLGKGKPKVTGGIYNTKRKTGSIAQQNLFGDAPVIIKNKNLHSLNYNSPKQINGTIEKLGLPKVKILEKDKVTHQKVLKDSLKEEAIQTYLLINRDTPLRSFFEKLLEYKGLQKFISSYGVKFLSDTIVKDGKREVGFLNKYTNRVHTQLKQCFTDNGRLSSGEDSATKEDEDVEKKMGVFNIQNMPAEEEVRECFELTQVEIDLGYWFTTIDWSGAELTIMAAMADDQYLFELGADRIINGVKVEGDMHSPTATDCWRAVYKYRLAKKPAIGFDSKEVQDAYFTIKDSKGKSYILTEDFLINRGNNKQLRTDFKPMIFGTVYGLQAKKGGETLNIPPDEAQVIINVIRQKFPKVFKMVEGFANHAFRHGYVEFNTRSHSRRYFTPVLEILKTIDQSKYSDKLIIEYVKEKLGFAICSEISAEAFNVPISGTQADMLKESLVEIRRHPDYETSKAKLLLSVHDENGAMHIGKEFGTTMKEIMKTVANRYLEIYSSNIRMEADCHIMHHWTKEGEKKPKIAA